MMSERFVMVPTEEDIFRGPFYRRPEDTPRRENAIETDLLPTLMQLGMLKSQGVPRDDIRIRDLDKEHFGYVQHMLMQKAGTSHGEKIAAYHGALQAYEAGGTTIEPFAQSVKNIMQAEFCGKERMEQDIASHGIGLVIATHPTHTADINMIDWGNNKVTQDIWPITSTLVYNSSLQGTHLRVRKFVQSAYGENEFTARAREDVGNVQLEKGTTQIAQQMKEIADKGELPLLYPEGGFRMLNKWNSGAIVVAVQAGFDSLYMTTQTPVDSLLEPQMRIHYVGRQTIPEEVIDAVHNRDCEKVIDFSHEVRRKMAQAAQREDYPKEYTDRLLLNSIETTH